LAINLLLQATSALDSNSERVVQDALDKAAKGGLRSPSLIGSPRSRTLIKCLVVFSKIDKLRLTPCLYFSFFFKDGKISEAGTHDQLLARRGDYYEYVQLQVV